MKLKKSEMKQLRAGMLEGLRRGTVSVPYLLLTDYPRLKLSDMEAMLLIHLISFVDKENKEFPTIEEIQRRMQSPPEKVIEALQRLMKDDFIAIDEDTDELTGVRYEKYNLDGLFIKLAESWAEEQENLLNRELSAKTEKAEKNIFTIFEKEFARPLTPMELETISGWLDEDRHTEELILGALKEAVFAGKVYFRYIDRILLEWARNRITTVEQAKEHTQKFRGR